MFSHWKYRATVVIMSQTKDKTHRNSEEILTDSISFSSSNSSEYTLEDSVLDFLNDTILQATQRFSYSPSMTKQNEKLNFFALFESVLELFTKKEFKWQIENSDTISYTESEKRICWLLLFLAVINITISTILAIIVSCTHEEETTIILANSYYIEKIGNYNSNHCITILNQ